MINKKHVLALIPARGGSKGLPGKNKRALCGKPLVTYPLHSAKKSKYVDDIFLSTDDEDILKLGKSFSLINSKLRPKQLAEDTSTTFEVINFTINYLKSKKKHYDYIVLLEPTSPLTTAEDVDKALEKLEKNRSIADSLVGISATENQHPSFSITIDEESIIYSINDEFKVLRRQELSEIYYFDGSIYISDIDSLLKNKSFYHQRTLGYITPKWKAFEIDDYIDFICVEAILKNLDTIKA